ncbi:MAG: iron-containing alcohol dehydrogenase [Planctomycetota bacterium]
MPPLSIPGQTNVLSSRVGRGVAGRLGEQLGRFVVTTMEVPWQICRDRVGGQPVAVAMVDSMERDVVETQIASLPACDVVLAIGGGRAIDFGKYLASERRCRLVSLPTVLSVDAFATPQAGLRINHRVEYVGDASPDPLVIDFDLLRTAPPELNIAGAGDLLSIHTAAFDWELAAAAGQSEYPFSAADVAAARRILHSVHDHAAAIRECTDVGLQAIVEGYLRVNALCLPAGHYRVEEGSEHFLFYELEERLRRPFIHGRIVALGIYVMSAWQRNNHQQVVDLMDELGLDYRPQAMDIGREDLTASLLSLAEYVRRSGRWYSVIDERPIDARWVDDLCDRLYEDH